MRSTFFPAGNSNRSPEKIVLINHMMKPITYTSTQTWYYIQSVLVDHKITSKYNRNINNPPINRYKVSIIKYCWIQSNVIDVDAQVRMTFVLLHHNPERTIKMQRLWVRSWHWTFIDYHKTKVLNSHSFLVNFKLQSLSHLWKTISMKLTLILDRSSN